MVAMLRPKYYLRWVVRGTLIKPLFALQAIVDVSVTKGADNSEHY